MATLWPLACATLAALPGAAATAPQAGTPITAAQQVSLCLSAADGAARRRAVLRVAPLAGEQAGRLTVTANTGEVTEIGAFPTGDAGQEQRYFLPGNEHTTCWIVEHKGRGAARMSIEWTDPIE